MSRLPRPFSSVAAIAAAALLIGLTGCASGPTASPEGAARAFLEAMKEDSLSAALEVLDPRAIPAEAENETTLILPDEEQKTSAPTGVTGFEIITQESEDDSATVIAELTGGSLTEMTFSITKAGPDGNDWLIQSIEPGFAWLDLASWSSDPWSTTLAGGTVVPDGVESIMMLPGSSIAEASATDSEGYFEPVQLVDRDGRLESDGLSVTDAGIAAAEQHHTDQATRLLDDLVSGARENPEYYRVVSEPAVEGLRFERESQGDQITGEITWAVGEWQMCARWKDSLWQPGAGVLEVRSFPFLSEGPGAVSARILTVNANYAPYPLDADKTQKWLALHGPLYRLLEPVDRNIGLLPLSECGA